ncbi:MAG: glycosyltransferase family 39 protein, partial [Chloroflexaceae bacterium]|nr:glycosyltransferase family 39 protein [Chloroflexaceae bacterium]
MADMTRFWNSDDYLTGVFALNILHGDTPLYYDGRTGTVSAYLAAPLLALFGTSSETLALVPLLLSALLTLALYGLGRDLFGVWGGLAAAAWWAVPSHPVLFWSLKPQPGYLEMLAFGTLMLWGGVRLLWGDGTTIQKLLLATLTGIAAALALWSNLLALSFVLAGGIFGLLAWQRLLRLPRWCYLALVVPPLLIWLGPLLYLYQIHPNLTPLGWLNDDINRNPGAQTALQGFLTRQLPLLLTGRVL